MSKSTRLSDTNRITHERSRIRALIEDENVLLILRALSAGPGATAMKLATELGIALDKVRATLDELILVDLVAQDAREYRLTSATRAQLRFGDVSYASLVGKTISGRGSCVEHPLPGSYRVIEQIGKGATSVTFKAVQSGTHRDRTLKIYLPATVSFSRLDRALKKRASLKHERVLPEIIEAGEVELSLPEYPSLVVPCVVLEHVDSRAQTFMQFLTEQRNLSPEVYTQFIAQVAGALEAIELVGLSHGDLHEGNILVVKSPPPASAVGFRVIDFVGIPSGRSPNLQRRTDLECFRDHLIGSAVVGCGKNPGVAARTLMGERAYRVLQRCRSGEYGSFSELMCDFRSGRPELPVGYFTSPADDPFEWLRVEWIPSSTWLFELFEPVASRFDVISRFGNTWISGPRGCGKSHYLRVLAFHPEALRKSRSNEALADILTALKYDPRRFFGVLFECRLGEFRAFTPSAMAADSYDVETERFLKHIFVLKIWNRTLQTIREGLPIGDNELAEPVLQLPSNLDGLVTFLEEKLGSVAVVEDDSPGSIFAQCVAACVVRENSATRTWHRPEERRADHLLDEMDLDCFFSVLKAVFPDLASARFFVLIDDASYGSVCFETQRVLNSLVRASQANHCFKITCDKFAYTLDTSDGRAIDPRHEVTYVDLGETSANVQRDTTADIDMSDYMARVIDRRLRAANYSTGIRHLLGDSQSPGDFLQALSLPGRRTDSSATAARPRAYYAGWNIVRNLAHGSVRTLLELVEGIFRTCGVKHDTLTVSLLNQHRAVHAYSLRQLKAVRYITNEQGATDLGARMQTALGILGSVSRMYLRSYETGDPRRWYETISIERADNLPLDSEASAVLEGLVRNGLLVDEGMMFSRTQLGLVQRYDMNKVFAPAMKTTYRVRNHLFMSLKVFEQWLIRPSDFLEKHRGRLAALAGNHLPQRELFEDSNDATE